MALVNPVIIHRMLPIGRRKGWIAAAALAIAACGSAPTSPDGASLPLADETATMRYYHEPGDTVEVTGQEAFNEWAVRRLGITLPRKIEYRKYVARAAMGRNTGNANSNGFAEPELWRIAGGCLKSPPARRANHQ